MLAYIARRLLWMVALLFAISAITFVIFYVLPSGDPAQRRAGDRASPQRVEAVRRQLGLDKPKVDFPWKDSQVRRYYDDLLLHQDLGTSYRSNNAKVWDLIKARLPATIQLAVGAVIVWMLVAIPVGIISALKRRSILDRATMGLTLIAISAPVYWLGLVMLYLFDETLGRFPLVAGIDAYPNGGFSADPARWFEAMLLPWIVLAASFAAIYARLLRSNLIEVMNEDYIRTARAKGLRERRVVMKHGVRSAATPVVTILGIDLGVLLGGAILTETVFNIPGIGRLAYNSITAEDIPTIQGTVLFAAFFIIVLNLLVDIAYSFLDPRVRY
jgi:peptide/nickel transport system permease protein